MDFERANGAFSCIAAMHVGQENFVVHLPNTFHDNVLPFTGFIVQYLEINDLIMVFNRVII